MDRLNDAYVGRSVGLNTSALRQRSTIRTRLAPDAWVASAFLVLAALLGGSSRFVLLPYVTLQLLSLAAIAYALWRLTPERRARTRAYAWAAIAIGGVMALQLIPLPPVVWNSLPGHAYYADALAQVGLANRWRPLSMTPDLTRESLLAVLPVLAAAMLFAPLDAGGRRLVLDALLLAILGCALIFVFRSGALSGGTAGDAGGGVFANRNHLALLLACGIVAATGRWRMARRNGVVPTVLMLCSIAVIVTLLIVNGSRIGLVAGALALLAAGAVFGRSALARQTGWRRYAVPAAALVAVAAVLALGMSSTQQVSVDRLLNTRATLTTTELRTANLPAVIVTARTFFPAGAGFGSFDPVFRRFESDALLRPSYFNHAHNDLLELIIEGGLPALILLVAGGVVLARRSPALLIRSINTPVVTAQIGLLGLVILGLGSLTDYPLRTPGLAVVAVLFATWAGAWASRQPGGAGVGLGTDDGLR